MGKRLADGTLKDPCLDHLKPGEPFFVLRGQDTLAPELVRLWALRAHQAGVSPEKVAEAIATADEMETWPHRKVPD